MPLSLFQQFFPTRFSPTPTPRFGNPVRRRQQTSFFDPNLFGGPEPFATPSTFGGGSRSGGLLDPQLIEGGGPPSPDVNTFPTEVLEDPEEAFQGALSRSSRGLSPNQLEFFRGERFRFFRMFQGQRNTQQERQATGELPADFKPQTFREFIQGVDFNRAFQNLAPDVRRGAGDIPGRFNRRVRFLN